MEYPAVDEFSRKPDRKLAVSPDEEQLPHQNPVLDVEDVFGDINDKNYSANGVFNDNDNVWDGILDGQADLLFYANGDVPSDNLHYDMQLFCARAPPTSIIPDALETTNDSIIVPESAHNGNQSKSVKQSTTREAARQRRIRGNLRCLLRRLSSLCSPWTRTPREWKDSLILEAALTAILQLTHSKV